MSPQITRNTLYKATSKIFCLVFLIGCAGACSPFFYQTKPDFEDRWIGTDQWAAEHGCNVNILPQFQNRKCEYYWIWGAFHTFDQLLPAEKYFNDHPEYYALHNGKRIMSQLCTSNVDVQRLVAEKIKDLLRQNAQLTGLTLGPNDNRFFCQCPECRALDEPDPPPDGVYSRRLFLFYKVVSELVHQEFPDVIIRFGAYDIYTAPPRDKTLALPPNTFPLICHFQQYCNNHPIADASCALNARFSEIIAGWRNLVEDLFVYEYYYKVNWLDLPWPIVHSIREDIPWYKKNGVKGLYSQYHPDSAGSLVNFYVAAALLLDVDADADKLVDSFCRETFGPAWTEMRAYFSTLEEAMVRSGRHIPHNGYAFPHAPYVFAHKVLRRCDHLLALAQKKANETPYADNVLKFVRLMRYTSQCVDFLRTANAVLLGKEGDGCRARKAERARVALDKGRCLMAFLKKNRKLYEGVIPTPEHVNPYMQLILNQLTEAVEASSDS
jgi:hypothetical protein